jgi:hypothetical protein
VDMCGESFYLNTRRGGGVWGRGEGATTLSPTVTSKKIINKKIPHRRNTKPNTNNSRPASLPSPRFVYGV